MHLFRKTWVKNALLGLGLVAGIAFGLAYRQQLVGQVAKENEVKKEEAKKEEAKKDAPVSAEEMGVHKTLEAFVQAFNGADAKKLAATFTPNAEYIDDEGNRANGSKEIEEMFAKFFADNKEAKLQVTPDGTRAVAPGVAIEDGESVVTVPDTMTQSTRKYTATFVKDGESWKIASVREYPEEPEVVSSEERLKSLEWFLGEWLDESGDSVVTSKVTLAEDKSHMMREFTIMQKGEVVLRGNQRIAVDPLTGTLKGWSFDNSGGYGESIWTAKSNGEWLIRGTGVTGDGDAASASYLMKPQGKDRIELKIINKVVNDTVEEDRTSIMVRKAIAPAKK